MARPEASCRHTRPAHCRNLRRLLGKVNNTQPARLRTSAWVVAGDLDMKWYAGAILVLLVALVFQLGLLAYAMYALLAVLTISRFLARAWTENLSATREVNRSTAEIGESVAVVVSVQHGGVLPVPWVLAEDVLPRTALRWPPRLRVTGSRYLIGSLFSMGRRTINYQLHFDM